MLAIPCDVLDGELSDLLEYGGKKHRHTGNGHNRVMPAFNKQLPIYNR